MSSGHAAVAQLREGIQGQVIGPEHPDYDSARRVWNGAFDRLPLAVVRPSVVEDVQRTISVAGDLDMRLAVRGGGHSLAGFSTWDDGIVLDLSGLNRVEVDVAGNRVRVAGGALLRDLDSATVAHGRVVPAGVVSHTGVGGLTLGGGMGWNSRRYGLSIDHLESLEVVTADSTRLTVNAESDADLFWALRGGGGNFGVVTWFEFTMRELGDPKVVTSVYPASASASVLRSMAEYANETPLDQTIGLFFRRDELVVKSIWFGDPSASSSRLKPVTEFAGIRAHTTMSTFTELQHASDEGAAWGICCYAKGGFVAQLDDTFISLMGQQLAAAPNADCDVYLIQIGGAVADVSDAETAYSGRSNAFYYVVTGVWQKPDDRDPAMQWGRETAALFSRASGVTSNYVNEQSDSSTDFVQRAYGPEKYERLVRVKRRLDPTNLFSLNQNIAP